MEDGGGVSVVWILVDVGFVLAAVWLLSREDAARGSGAKGDTRR